MFIYYIGHDCVLNRILWPSVRESKALLSQPVFSFSFWGSLSSVYHQPGTLQVHPHDSRRAGHMTVTYLQELRLTVSVGRALTTSMQGGYLGRTPAASPPPSRSPGDKTAVPVWWRTRCLSWVELRTPHTQSTWHETRCPELASHTPSVRYVPNIPGTFSHTSWRITRRLPDIIENNNKFFLISTNNCT